MLHFRRVCHSIPKTLQLAERTKRTTFLKSEFLLNFFLIKFEKAIIRSFKLKNHLYDIK